MTQQDKTNGLTQLERQLTDKVRYLDEMLTESEIQWRSDGEKLDAANKRVNELETQLEAIDEALGVTAAHKTTTQENAVDAIEHLKSELAKARERIATLESQYEACVQLNRWESEDYERQLKREYAALCNLQDRVHELARALEKLGYVYPAYELRALLDALSGERPKPDSGELPAVHLSVSGDVFRAGGTTDDGITWTIYSEAAMGPDVARTQVFVGGRKVADISVHAHAHDLVEEVQQVGAALVWSAIRAVRMRGGKPANEQPVTERRPPFTWSAEDREKLVPGARVTWHFRAGNERAPESITIKSFTHDFGSDRVWCVERGTWQELEWCDPTTIIVPESDDAEPSVYDAQGVVT